MNPGTLARPDLIAALAYPLWVPGVGLIGFLLLLFPDGHLPSPRWRPVAWLLGGTIAILGLTELFLPGVFLDWEYVNPLGIEALEPFREGAPGVTLVLILVLCILASAVSVVVRYRRAVGIERLQLKWMMAAGLVAAIAYALLFFWDGFYIQLVWTVIPVAIGLSMHRHRLYDIDRLISRTVAYTLVVGLLAIVYAGSVFLLRERLPGQGNIAVAASTLAVAALFNPLRRRVPGAGGPSIQSDPPRRLEGRRDLHPRPQRPDRPRPNRQWMDRGHLRNRPTGNGCGLGALGGVTGPAIAFLGPAWLGSCPT